MVAVSIVVELVRITVALPFEVFAEVAESVPAVVLKLTDTERDIWVASEFSTIAVIWVVDVPSDNKRTETPQKVSYMVVSEAGASVYSASKLAAEEFPEFDVSLRSAVSIARRLQDPLAELVKIDPKAIGVGQYQHDMPKARMDEALSGVVEDCVNSVGVDLNTASHSLLSYIA